MKIIWIESRETMECSLEFSDFSEAFSFITRVALLAEKHNHHPQITNVYNKVKLGLSTHDAGNIVTDKDRMLANDIEALLHQKP